MKSSIEGSKASRTFTTLVVAVFVLVVLVIGTACGGGGGKKTPASTKTTVATGSSASSAAAEAGKKIAQTSCFTCHSIDGRTIVGPTWKGVYGSKVEFQDGSSGTVDDAYIKESIQNPNAKIVKGFPAAMPSFKGVLSDQQINDIIAYIKSLK